MKFHREKKIKNWNKVGLVSLDLHIFQSFPSFLCKRALNFILKVLKSASRVTRMNKCMFKTPEFATMSFWYRKIYWPRSGAIWITMQFKERKALWRCSTLHRKLTKNQIFFPCISYSSFFIVIISIKQLNKLLID